MSDLELYQLNTIIVLSDNHIIKVVRDDDTYYYGYDILTEEFKKVIKNKSVPINKIIVQLLGDEVMRTKLALALTNSNIKAAKMLNVSERTLFRIKQEHLDVPEKIKQ